MDRKDIFVIQGNQYKEMAVRVLEAARVAEDIGDRGRCVGLKPNLVVARDALPAERQPTRSWWTAH